MTPGPDGLVESETVRVADVPVVACGDFDRAVDWVVERARPIAPGGRATVIRFVNAYTLSLAVKDAAYRGDLSAGGVNFPDGTPVAWYAARASAVPHTAMGIRHRGPDVFVQCLDRGRTVGATHFFLGSTSENLTQVVETARRTFPGIVIAGWWAPPVVDDARTLVDESVRRIAEANPSVVWVGIGTPKQDVLAVLLAARGPTTVICVGAALDFFAGTVRQAPRWVQNAAMEWLFRLAFEPRRLWRRYLIDSGRFIVAAERYRRSSTVVRSRHGRACG